MSIITHTIYTKKMPRSQEQSGRVIKKVPKGLNCYNEGQLCVRGQVYFLSIQLATTSSLFVSVGRVLPVRTKFDDCTEGRRTKETMERPGTKGRGRDASEPGGRSGGSMAVAPNEAITWCDNGDQRAQKGSALRPGSGLFS